MPTEIAKCTCDTCGAKFTRQLSESGSGASARLREKIAWAESGGINECSDCYKARRRKEAEAAGLTCDIRLGRVMDTEVRIYAVFGGDSYAQKDALKAAGCRYTDNYPTGKALSDLIGLAAPPKAWVLVGTDPDEVIDRAKALRPAKITLPDETDLAVWSSFRASVLAMRQEREAKLREQLDALGPIPAWPESVAAKWPDGAQWNGKIYGRSGGYSIYLAGNKVSLSDEEAAAMQAALEAREAWRVEKKIIEGKDAP